MQLKSMTAYVREQEEIKRTKIGSNSFIDFYDNVRNYAKFLSMPLELKMFVPCDNEGNFFSEPQLIEKRLGFDEIEEDYDYSELEIYKYALSEVIFEGFEFKSGLKALSNNQGCIIIIHENGNYSLNGKQVAIIEDLVKYKLTLTEKAVEKYKL